MVLSFLTFTLLVINAVCNCCVCVYDDVKIEDMKIEDDIDDYFYITMDLFDTEYPDVKYHLSITTHKEINLLKITSFHASRTADTKKISEYDYSSMSELILTLKRAFVDVYFDMQEVFDLCEK